MVFCALTPVSAIRPWRVIVVCLFLTAIFYDCQYYLTYGLIICTESFKGKNKNSLVAYFVFVKVKTTG